MIYIVVESSLRLPAKLPVVLVISDDSNLSSSRKLKPHEYMYYQIYATFLNVGYTCHRAAACQAGMLGKNHFFLHKAKMTAEYS